MTELKHVVNLVIGDWSNDGHCMRETVTVGVNLTRDELFQAYQDGSKKVGFNLTDDAAADYEDRTMLRKHWDILVTAGLKSDDFFTTDWEKEEHANESDEPYVTLHVDAFAELWLFIAQLGNPNLKYEKAENPDINIGGYGLLSH